MQSAQAQTVLDPAQRLAAAVLPFDPRCPACVPEAEDAAELCDTHYTERWTPTLRLAAVHA